MFSKNAFKYLNKGIKPIYDRKLFENKFTFDLMNNTKQNTLYSQSLKCFAKKTNKKEKNKIEVKEDWFDLEQKHDKAFEDYVKAEEKLKKEKEQEIEKEIAKREEGMKCLVLHPVFQEK
jgi:hypothetical protein